MRSLKSVTIGFAALAFVSVCASAYKSSPLTIVNPYDLIKSKAVGWKDTDLSYLKALGQVEPSTIYNQTFETNDTCVLNLNQLLLDLAHFEPYALQMADSWGKLGPGILKGNLIWLGRYHECLTVENKDMDTQYCLAHFGAKPQAAMAIGMNGLQLGSCFPASCSISNISTLFNIVNSVTHKNSSVEVTCPKPFDHWDFKEVFGMVVLCLVMFVVLSATLWEYFSQFIKKPAKDQEEILLAPSLPDLEKGLVERLFLCFSAIGNTKRLLSTEQKATDIHCLHGMRFLSMSWVLLGHSFLFVAYWTDNLLYPASYLVNHFEYQAIANATFSVDSFFFLSGLLAAYLGMREIVRRNGNLNVPLMYLLRYVRLTPAYAFCILMSISLWPKLGQGPIWPSIVDPMVESCNKYWFSNLLYFNNLYPASMATECYAWGWYLANDMQFYLLLPLILFFLYKTPIGGLLLTNFLLLASITITGVFSYITREQPQTVTIAYACNQILHPEKSLESIPDPATLQKNLYISDIYAKPWCRLGAYIVGIMTGYLLHKQPRILNCHKGFAALGWVLAAAVNLSVLYGLFPTVNNGGLLTASTAAFYNAMSRPAWSFGLAWVVYACVNGYGGPVNSLLSWKGFIPLSRLTYCSYLIHPLVIWWFFGTQEVLTHYSIPAVLMLFFGTLVVANLLAVLVHLLVEAPLGSLTKLLMGNKNQLPPVHIPVSFDNPVVEINGEQRA